MWYDKYDHNYSMTIHFQFVGLTWSQCIPVFPRATFSTSKHQSQCEVSPYIFTCCLYFDSKKFTAILHTKTSNKIYDYWQAANQSQTLTPCTTANILRQVVWLCTWMNSFSLTNILACVPAMSFGQQSIMHLRERPKLHKISESIQKWMTRIFKKMQV